MARQQTAVPVGHRLQLISAAFAEQDPVDRPVHALSLLVVTES